MLTEEASARHHGAWAGEDESEDPQARSLTEAGSWVWLAPQCPQVSDARVGLQVCLLCETIVTKSAKSNDRKCFPLLGF